MSFWGLAAASFSRCATTSTTGIGFGAGAALGAGTGAIVGSQTGDAGAGALIGGALGGVGGAVVGDQMQGQEQQQTEQQKQLEEQQREIIHIQRFIDKNRAAMVDFMEDMLRITRWYLDPKNHDEVAKIASKITKAPPERFGWLFTNKDNYRDPNLMPNLDALQKNVDTTQQLGFIKKRIDIKKHADLSLVQEAAKRLK